MANFTFTSVTTSPELDRIYIGYQDPAKITYTDTAADVILQDVLDRINVWNAENDPRTDYTIAECPTTTISIELSYETHLKWIQQIAYAL